MATKHLEAIIQPRPAHYVGDGFRVHNFIPGFERLNMQRMDPFIMLDYNSKYEFPASTVPKGVGVHPHRGFETVTIAYQGRVQHHDSSGGGGIIGQGDVQWMTAASGVLHKEYHEKEWSEKGGVFQMVQLWVNLPAKEKMSKPKYQSIENASMKRVDLGGNGYVEVIAGEYNGEKGSASTFTPVNMMNAKLKAGGKAEFSFPAHYTTAGIVIEGNIIVNGEKKVPTDYMLLFENQGEEFVIEAEDDAVILIFSGEPIKEPIFAYGPFVMNTREEIIQAYEDFNNGKFGILED